MVAWGLKARVALAMQDYTNAANYAAKSISLAEAKGHKLMTGNQLNHGFANITSETKEAMYAAMTPDDMTVYFYSFYAYMSWNFSSSANRQGVKCINAETYDTMSQTDLRRAWWDPTGKRLSRHPFLQRTFIKTGSLQPVQQPMPSAMLHLCVWQKCTSPKPKRWPGQEMKKHKQYLPNSKRLAIRLMPQKETQVMH